ncbi:MAG: hypothetical protein EOM49_04620 [Epsilonproteobacteria bacterium]|nr:hypothetical protein [Campylobacterota bacterium]
MLNTDKYAWLLWKILASIVFVSTTAFFISSHGITLEFNLIEGKKINVELFRFLPDHFGATLWFPSVHGEKRPELGDFQSIGDWRKTGVLEFVNPGEPVKLVISDSNQNVVYEAMPAGGYTSTDTKRDLIRYEEGRNPFQFSWPPYDGKRFLLHAGFNEFQITILEVGKSLVGGKVTLYISPPLGFKHLSNGLFYRYLWFFHAWPVYVFILLIFYLILLYRKSVVAKKLKVKIEG